MSTATRTPAAARRSGADLLAVAIKVKRYQPDRSDKPYWQEFQLQVEPKDRLVDALNQIKWEQDGTLTFRRSCLHGVCGSDAMRVNGRNRLACKLLMKDVGTRITIEPMLGFPVIRDLVVDMDPFFAKYEKVKPFLINDEPAPAAERLQSAEERARYDDTTKCILCGACTGSCPSVWANRDWVGPASIVNAHRFIFDSRDRAAGERLRILGDRNGVWRCRTIFNCTEACPRGIHVTDAIEEVKRAIMYGSTETE
ncbi:MAG TPA: succinate dehydrogenase iron-sulfur subunit [Ktedonobacterales bacterium]|jgi:succinate dehydrogenase / fumarate reductase iron-sulfur subunit